MSPDRSDIAPRLECNPDATEELKRVVADLSGIFRIAQVRVGRRVLADADSLDSLRSD